MTPPAGQGGPVLAAYAMVLATPFVFLRLVLGRRPFAAAPPGHVPLFLGLGAGSALLAVGVNVALARTGLFGFVARGFNEGLPLVEALLVSFALAGVVEEGAKLLVLRAGVARCPDHASVLVAGLLVGTGFGIVENLANVHGATMSEAGRATLRVGLVRSFVLLHPIATGLAADGLGRRAFGPPRWAGALWRGFALAVLVHGLWDFSVFWQPGGIWIVQSLAFPWLIWWGGRTVSDRVLRLSGRAPARVAGRRPAWAGATLVAFGVIHGQAFWESARLLVGGSPGPITLYGLDLPGIGAAGLAAYNLLLSSVGLSGVLAMGAGRRWGPLVYAVGATAGLVTEIGVIAAASARGVLAFSGAELSDDLVGAASALLWLSRPGRRALARPPAPPRPGRRQRVPAAEAAPGAGATVQSAPAAPGGSGA